MQKVLGWTGATLGGAIGWWIGSPGGIMGAFIVSVIGTAAGLMAGRALADRLGG